MFLEIATTSCWVILVSSLITSGLALTGLLSKSYHETLAENITLACVALAGVVVALQIYSFTMARVSGIAFLAASVAMYAMAMAHKQWRHQCTSQ